jgi:hypothetical protein
MDASSIFSDDVALGGIKTKLSSRFFSNGIFYDVIRSPVVVRSPRARPPLIGAGLAHVAPGEQGN